MHTYIDTPTCHIQRLCDRRHFFSNFLQGFLTGYGRETGEPISYHGEEKKNKKQQSRDPVRFEGMGRPGKFSSGYSK